MAPVGGAEEALHGLNRMQGTRRGQDVEGVVGPAQLAVGHRRPGCRPEPADEAASLLDRYEDIAVAVEHEKWWRAGMHPVDR